MEKLNLSPQERRLVAFVGLVVFIVLNIWLVWPKFGDWRKVQAERDKAERTLARYRAEIKRVPEYEAQRIALEQQGASVVAEDQDLDLATLVAQQSVAHKMEISSQRPIRSASPVTNQFFEEQALSMDVRSGTEELVNFMVSLTSSNSLIRVRDLTLRPDPPNAPHRLLGQLTLVASYQRKPAIAQAATAPAVTPVPQGGSAAPRTNAASIGSRTNTARLAPVPAAATPPTNRVPAGRSKASPANPPKL
jgi:Tfp pilus assembly protein PilO